MVATGRAEVAHAAGVLAGLLQRHLPGRIAGLHLVGSAVDGDFQPGRSDLDIVGVFHAPVTDEEFEALGIVHRLYGGDPTLPLLGGIWITTADLAAGPDSAPAGPTTLDGLLIGVGRANRDPVAWAALSDNAVTVFGELDRSQVWRDPKRLVSWMHENVEAYWVGWLRRASSFATTLGISMLGRKMPMWGVLGISRLHYTVATRKIASKSAAGEYAKTAFDPRWRPIIDECLAVRHGLPSLYRNPLARRRDALAFVSMGISAIRGQPPSE